MPRLSPLPLSPLPLSAVVLLAVARVCGGCVGAVPQPVDRPARGGDTGPPPAVAVAAGAELDTGAALDADRPSAWRCADGCDPGRDPAGDCDADGLLNRDELSLAGRRGPAWTDPCAADGDLDGLSDCEELAWGLLPFDPDSDGDGLGDAWAVEMARTAGDGAPPAARDAHPRPAMRDGDRDGIPDMAERCTGAAPGEADTDGDGLPDGDDLWRGCDPARADTDGDGWADGEEAAAGASCRRRRDAPRAAPAPP